MVNKITNIKLDHFYQLHHLSYEPPHHDKMAIADTGATGHYPKHTAPHVDVDSSTPNITVDMPYGGLLHSTKGCKLDLSTLS